MRDIYGDIFNIHADAVCITTNGFTKRNGRAVMGRGIALEIQKYYPDITKKLGDHLRKEWNVPGILYSSNKTLPAIISLPVKPDKLINDGSNCVSHCNTRVGECTPGFLAKASVGLIVESCKRLVKLANQEGWKKVLIPRPGCGAGELNYHRDVRPHIETILDDRFYVVTFSHDTRRYYAGIGSRRTPKDILEIMSALALKLAETYVLRSGGAKGADSAFSDILDPIEKQIFIPWKGYNNVTPYASSTVDQRAIDIAKSIHPDWNGLSMGAKKLHARNVYQILGRDMKSIHSEFVICWTPGGKTVGGTATAIRLAKRFGIPVYNLGNTVTLNRVKSIVSKP